MMDFVPVTTEIPQPVSVSPVDRIKKVLGKAKEKLAILFSATAALPHAISSATGRTRTFFSKKKIGTFLFFVIVAIAIIAGLRVAFSQRVASNNQGLVVADAITTAVNQEFTFPVYDSNKKLSEPVKYNIVSAQLAKQIIIKGQWATAVKGRTFFILNLKLVNDFDKSLFLNTRNYVRIQPAGTEDKLAPEIHNDTVEVQPDSTKLTRIGLPVDETVKEFTLFVGEIDGEKQEIPIKF